MKIIMIDRDEKREELDVIPRGTLMEVLREKPNGVAAICGGLTACGTCHIYVSEPHLSRLPEQSEDELTLLEGLAYGKPESRLSCQIQLEEDLDEITIELAPEE